MLDQDVYFPDPIHFLDLPRGYEGSRNVALKHVNRSSGRFHELREPDQSLPRAVGAREALDDLPVIREHTIDPQIIRRRKLSEILPYRNVLLSDYAVRMRQWKGFQTKTGADGHLVRLTPRDFPIFARMEHGADYPRARALAEEMFEEAIAAHGMDLRSQRSTVFQELRASIVPPYDPGKFPNKWWKLDPQRPSRTLTAHMGKDTYSHIHYDSRQRRTVSVREAARLQSFPDGFRFAGAMNAAFRQIGNAVPPLLGFAVAKILRRQLEEAAQADTGSRAGRKVA